MSFLNKIILFLLVFFVFNTPCMAKQTRILVVPVKVDTVNTAAGLYPNIGDLISNDLINELNKNLNFDIPDLNSAENELMSHGLWENYKKFLGNYKDRGIIDYKIIALIREKMGIDKIILISSGFSVQSMMIKRPFLYKIGFTQFEPVQSLYRMDVRAAMIDTQTFLIDHEQTYSRNFKTNNFEIPSNSLSDNIVSARELKRFSESIARRSSTRIFEKIDQEVYTQVQSKILPEIIFTEDKTNTTEGLSSFTNDEYIKNIRVESFKNWIRQRVEF